MSRTSVLIQNTESGRADMRLSIEGAVRLTEGVWKVALTLQDTRIFGEAGSRYGNWTIVAVDEEPRYDRRSELLSFDPHFARLLNLGDSDVALVLGPARAQSRKGAAEKIRPAETTRLVPRGDRHFLENLTEATRAVGEQFLGGLRRLIPGELEYRQRSGKYIETPDNFWTVRIQPRDKSLRVTVRGNPEEFRVPPSIELRSDMGGYSAFKVHRSEDVENALAIILQADERRKRKSAG
jgi:hypothetical protein